MSEPIAIGGSSVVVDSFSKFEEMAGREASQQLFGNGATFSSTIAGTGERRIAEKPLPQAPRQTTPSSFSGVEIAGRQAKPLGINLGVVCAEQRRRRDRHVALRHLHGPTRDRDLAPH